jgi:hypothetical protein
MRRSPITRLLKKELADVDKILKQGRDQGFQRLQDRMSADRIASGELKRSRQAMSAVLAESSRGPAHVLRVRARNMQEWLAAWMAAADLLGRLHVMQTAALKTGRSAEAGDDGVVRRCDAGRRAGIRECARQ